MQLQYPGVSSPFHPHLANDARGDAFESETVFSHSGTKIMSRNVHGLSLGSFSVKFVHHSPLAWQSFGVGGAQSVIGKEFVQSS